MAYKYLLELYNVLDCRMAEIKNAADFSNPKPDAQRYQQGRFDCLTDLRRFLKENYHRKLPRRIQKTVE